MLNVDSLNTWSIFQNGTSRLWLESKILGEAYGKSMVWVQINTFGNHFRINVVPYLTPQRDDVWFYTGRDYRSPGF